MKRLCYVALLLCFSFRSPAQDGSSPGSSHSALQKDSIAAIEKLISDGKKILQTDTSQALQLLRIATAKANRLETFYLEGKAWFT